MAQTGRKTKNLHRYRIREKAAKNYSPAKISRVADRLGQFMFRVNSKARRDFSSKQHIDQLLGLYRKAANPEAKAVVAHRMQEVLAARRAGPGLRGLSRGEIQELSVTGKENRAKIQEIKARGKPEPARKSDFDAFTERLDGKNWVIADREEFLRLENLTDIAAVLAIKKPHFEKVARYYSILAQASTDILGPRQTLRTMLLWVKAHNSAQRSHNRQLEREIVQRAQNAGVKLREE